MDFSIINPIIPDTSLFNNFPFEIYFIYNKLYEGDNGGLRFAKVNGEGFFFYIEIRNIDSFWQDVKQRPIYTENRKKITDKNIQPYFRKFADGFLNGYVNFEKDVLNKNSLFVGENNTAKQIFQTILKPPYGLRSYSMNFSENKPFSTLNKDLWFSNGKEQGANYKAWEIIINTHWNFTDLFLTNPKFVKYYNSSLEYYSKKSMYLGVYEQLQKIISKISPPQAETKTEKLKTELGKYGFFELPKVKQLSEPNKQSLVEWISTNGLPYSIAMFDFLGFLNHIETEHFQAKNKLNKEVAKWFNSDKDGRAVKGNISSLSDYSTENKSKYTAHTHKETVKTDYQKLK